MPPSPAPALPHPRLRTFAQRFLNPLVIRLGIAGARGSPIGLVRHVGRRSGTSHATPLAIHRQRDRLILPLSYGPNAQWCLNVQAAAGCRIRLGGRELTATRPRVVGRASLPRNLAAFYRLVGMREFLELIVDEPPGSAASRAP